MRRFVILLLAIAVGACGRGRDTAAAPASDPPAAGRDTSAQAQSTAADSQPDPPCLASQVGLPCQ